MTAEPRISVAIQAHPSRKAAAEALKDSIGLPAVIAYDPDPEGEPSAIRSAAVAWNAVADDATHHLVLQDDVEPCTDFSRALREVVGRAPDSVVCLLTIWLGCRAQLLRLGASLGHRLMITSPDRISPEAIVMPAEDARAYGALLRGHLVSGQATSRDSLLLQDYLDRRRAELLVSIPNLVDHDTRSLPSLMPLTGSPSGIRRSAYFVPDPAASGIGWDRKSPAGMVGGNELPILSDKLVGQVVTESGTTTTWHWLTARGHAVEELISSARGFVDRCHESSGPLADLSDAVLIETWSVVYAMGVVLAQQGPIADDAESALSTVLPAAVCRVLRLPALEALRQQSGRLLAPVLIEGAQARDDYQVKP